MSGLSQTCSVNGKVLIWWIAINCDVSLASLVSRKYKQTKIYDFYILPVLQSYILSNYS